MNLITTLSGSLLEGFFPAGWDLAKIDACVDDDPTTIEKRQSWWHKKFEPVLCESLGVSRTVVREAVKSLVAKGLLVTGPKLGTRVLPEEHWNWFDPDVVAWQSKAGLTREFLRDLQELRRVVEPAAVRLAADRATTRPR